MHPEHHNLMLELARLAAYRYIVLEYFETYAYYTHRVEDHSQHRKMIRHQVAHDHSLLADHNLALNYQGLLQLVKHWRWNVGSTNAVASTHSLQMGVHDHPYHLCLPKLKFTSRDACRNCSRRTYELRCASGAPKVLRLQVHQFELGHCLRPTRS